MRRIFGVLEEQCCVIFYLFIYFFVWYWILAVVAIFHFLCAKRVLLVNGQDWRQASLASGLFYCKIMQTDAVCRSNFVFSNKPSLQEKPLYVAPEPRCIFQH